MKITSKLLAVIAVIAFCSTAHAQSMARYTLESWDGSDMAVTYDHPFIEAGGHANNSTSDSQVFSWDSFGRVRFSREDQDAPFVAYRILTIDAGTDSTFIHSTMDDLELPLGLHLGNIADWKMATVLGIGFSSTKPFVNGAGFFGIGHLTFEKAINPEDSLVLSLDYEGNAGLLPDVPLPGFAWTHHGPQVDAMLGLSDEQRTLASEQNDRADVAIHRAVHG